MDRYKIKIDKAIFEANRFIELAEVWKKRFAQEKYIYPSKENGACKRASLDLSRALSELRKS
jgi:hypothetical protein